MAIVRNMYKPVKHKHYRGDVLMNDSDVKYIAIESTTYEVVSNYAGEISLLDIVKSAIRRDIESDNY